MAICVDIVPTPCGGTNKLTMKDACNDVHFTGIEDTTINQGVGIDLTEGIHAYDGNGNEIEYTVTPDSIDKCDVGEHTVVYRTIGEGDKFLPSFCMDNVDVTLGDTFCNEILLEEDRIVTITQADPPTIEGIETIPTIYPNEEFDPTEGITATDDNGKTIDFTYSGRVEDSSEGAIASFETEFEQDALSVVADIEPIQDLHGYDKPWVGGAGKNKLHVTATTQTINGVTFTVNDDGTVKVNGTASGGIANLVLTNGTGIFTFTSAMKLTGCVTGYGNNLRIRFGYTGEGAFAYDDLGNGVTIPIISDISTRYCYVQITVTSGATINNALLKPMISETGGTFEPYSNICPISGHDEVNVTRVGKNLLDPTYRTYTLQNNVRYYRYGGGGIKLRAGATYTLSVDESCTRPSGIYINIYGTSTHKSLAYRYNSYSVSFTPTEDVVIETDCYYLNAPAEGIENIKVQLEVGSIATDYEPYQGDTYTTALGRTVYGGTLDVVSGVLTVDRAMVDLSTLGWGVADGVRARSRVIDFTRDNGWSGDWRVTKSNVFNCVDPASAYSNRADYSFANISHNYYNFDIKVPNGAYADGTAFKSWLADVDGNGTHAYICIELATPQTIQLTPQEVELLLGQNNVWADTGDIKVIYEKEMPASGNIEYLTAGLKIITYTATDECGNQTVEQRIVYVLGDTPQVCMAEVCTAHVACEDNQ